MQNTEKIAELIKKQLDGILTPDEKLQLQHWVDRSAVNEIFLRQVVQKDLLWEDVLIWLELENSDQEEWQRRLERQVFAKISQPIPVQQPSRIMYRLIPYAAAVLLFIIAGGLYYYLSKDRQALDNKQIVQDIAPGGNKATLRTADGQTIELSGEKKGIVIGEKLTYDDGTVLTSPTSNKGKSEEISFSILTTPKGGQYQIELPDGTKVWLNAASTLRYPTRFSGGKRIVELEGEAYFEVAQVRGKDNYKNSSQKIPFLVKTPNQDIEVLGTQFNVSAYADEPETKTTLVEGSVVLTSNGERVKLVPGEQGVSDHAKLVKVNANVMESIAWKNNKFIFNETELRVAMNQLSRWYDLQIVYEGNIPHTYFYGEISRTKSLSEVLKILQAGGVNFRIERVKEQNRLIVVG